MDAKRVLVVDDDSGAREVLVRILSQAGYEVVDAFNAEEALALLHRGQFDLVTLDVAMPYVDGFECCRRIREFSQVPVIFVTGWTALENEVTGLETGADDYITKPYRPEAVLSRLRAVLRRSAPHLNLAGALQIGPLRLDPAAQEAHYGQQRLGLTGKEFELLRLLVLSCGQVVDRPTIAREVWGTGLDGNSKTLDVHIYRLRKKLDEAGGLGRFLITKRDRGYMLDPALRAAH